MNVISGVLSLKKNLSNTVITIGNFDGLHLGHRKILKTVLEEAKKNYITSASNGSSATQLSSP